MKGGEAPATTTPPGARKDARASMPLPSHHPLCFPGGLGLARLTRYEKAAVLGTRALIDHNDAHLNDAATMNMNGTVDGQVALYVRRMYPDGSHADFRVLRDMRLEHVSNDGLDVKTEPPCA